MTESPVSEDVKAEAPKRRGRPPKVETPKEQPQQEVSCKVLVPNLWTSKGRFLARESVGLPADEAANLEGKDLVVTK